MFNYRLYTFVNFYFSSIQQGIQSAHIVHEMFTKHMNYAGDMSDQFKKVIDWAESDKTIIVLNGGTNPDLNALVNLLYTQRTYPWTDFKEDAGLDNIRTSVGVILPETVWGARHVDSSVDEHTRADIPAYFKYENEEGYSAVHFDHTFEYKLLQLMKTKRLAS